MEDREASKHFSRPPPEFLVKRPPRDFFVKPRGCAGLLAEHLAQFGYQGKSPRVLVIIVDSVPATARDNLFFK